MSILFATPCYGGLVTEPHFQSCLNLKEELTQKGVPHDWLTGRNESLITRARNEMTANYLTTNWSSMMWKDADIEFTPEDVAKLWNLDVDIAVGVYAMKKRDAQWYAAWKDGALVKDLDQYSGPIAVDFAGTGFMLIKRSAIEKIIAYIDDLERKAKSLFDRLAPGLADDDVKTLARMRDGMAASYEGPNGRVPALYMTPIHNDGLESEDYHFCRIAREAGFKIIMDPSVRLGHWGQYRYGA